MFIFLGPHSIDSRASENDFESPEFEVYHFENYTIQQGASAFLPCVIQNLGNETVSQHIMPSLKVLKLKWHTVYAPRNVKTEKQVIFG